MTAYRKTMRLFGFSGKVSRAQSSDPGNEATVLVAQVSISIRYQAASRGLMVNTSRRAASHERARWSNSAGDFAIRQCEADRSEVSQSRCRYRGSSIFDWGGGGGGIEDDAKEVPVLLQHTEGRRPSSRIQPRSKLPDVLDALLLNDLRTEPRTARTMNGRPDGAGVSGLRGGPGGGKRITTAFLEYCPPAGLRMSANERAMRVLYLLCADWACLGKQRRRQRPVKAGHWKKKRERSWSRRGFSEAPDDPLENLFFAGRNAFGDRSTPCAGGDGRVTRWPYGKISSANWRSSRDLWTQHAKRLSAVMLARRFRKRLMRGLSIAGCTGTPTICWSSIGSHPGSAGGRSVGKQPRLTNASENWTPRKVPGTGAVAAFHHETRRREPVRSRGQFSAQLSGNDRVGAVLSGVRSIGT